MNCNHNLSIHSLYLFVNIIKPDRFGLSIDLILSGYKIENTNKVMNKTNTNSSLLKLLILSVFMCKYVNFCIFDFLFQLTLTRFISTMHSGAFDKIIFNKIYEKMDLRIRSINTRGLGDKFKRRQIFNWLKCKKKCRYILSKKPIVQETIYMIGELNGVTRYYSAVVVVTKQV